MADVKVTSRAEGRGLILTLKGPLTGMRARDAADAFRVEAGVEPRPVGIIADIAACTSIDTLGMEALAVLGEVAPVYVVGANGFVADQLTLLPLAQNVHPMPRGNAMAALHGQARYPRRHNRAHVAFPCLLQWDDPTGRRLEARCRTRDVSESGLGIDLTGLPYEQLRELREAVREALVRVRVDSLLGMRWVRGRIVPHPHIPGQRSVGVEFDQLSRTVRKHIRKVVSRTDPQRHPRPD